MRPPRRASKTSTSRSTRRRCGGGSPTTRRSSHGCVLRRCRQEERRWRPPADHEYLSSEATKHRRSTFLGEATGYQAGLCPMRDVKGRRHLPIHCREAMIRDRAQASARWAAAAVAFACALGAVLLTLLPAAALATPAAQDLESLQAQAKQARAEVARLDYAQARDLCARLLRLGLQRLEVLGGGGREGRGGKEREEHCAQRAGERDRRRGPTRARLCSVSYHGLTTVYRKMSPALYVAHGAQPCLILYNPPGPGIQSVVQSRRGVEQSGSSSGS